MKNVYVYKLECFSDLPKLINRALSGDHDFFCVAVDGSDISDGAYSLYHDLTERYHIGFAFYPYHEIIPTANMAFGNPNPLIDITLSDGAEKINAVRQINYGVMFFNKKYIYDVKIDVDYQFAFMEKFADDLSSVGSIPSNGMFIDIHDSWKLFSKYRRLPLQYNDAFAHEFKKADIKLDGDTSKLIKFLMENNNDC